MQTQIDKVKLYKKNGLKISYSDIQIQIWLKFSITNSIYTHLKLKINPTQHDFLTMKNNSPQLNMSVNIDGTLLLFSSFFNPSWKSIAYKSYYFDCILQIV